MTADGRDDTMDAMRTEIGESWNGFPCGAHALKILDAFEADPDARDLSVDTLAELAGCTVSEVLASVSVLSASRVEALDISSLFDDGDRIFRLSGTDVLKAMEDGWLAHPEDGHRVGAWEERTVPVVNPSKRLAAALLVLGDRPQGFPAGGPG